MKEQRAVVAMTTVGNGKDATRISRALVEERLAACVSTIPRVMSTYRWEGQVVAQEEYLLLIKTTPAVVGQLRARLLEMHPYDVPELLVVDAKGVPEPYASWLEQSTGVRQAAEQDSGARGA
jgi:periplasmic divalent cation tolerance protein